MAQLSGVMTADFSQFRIEVDKSVGKLLEFQRAGKGTSDSLDGFSDGLRQVDSSLSAMGIRIGPQIRALDEFRALAGKSIAEIGLAGLAGAITATGVAAYQATGLIMEWIKPWSASPRSSGTRRHHCSAGAISRRRKRARKRNSSRGRRSSPGDRSRTSTKHSRSSKPATMRCRLVGIPARRASANGIGRFESAREWGSADDHARTQRRLVHREAARGTVRHQRRGDRTVRQSDERKQRHSRKVARERASGDREDAPGARRIEPGRRRLAEHADDDRAGDGGGGDAVLRDGCLADGARDEVRAHDVSSPGARQSAQRTDRDARPQRARDRHA